MDDFSQRLPFSVIMKRESSLDRQKGESELLLCGRLTLKNFFTFVEIRMNFDLIWKFKYFFRDPICTFHLWAMHQHKQWPLSLRCDYDDADDIQRSATLAMSMRFYYYFYSPFLLCFFFSIRGIITQLHFSPREKIFRVLTCINITPNCSDAAREAQKITQICFINKLHI